jgi:hypothetical protein
MRKPIRMNGSTWHEALGSRRRSRTLQSSYRSATIPILARRTVATPGDERPPSVLDLLRLGAGRKPCSESMSNEVADFGVT